jgi:hypothetical protein
MKLSTLIAITAALAGEGGFAGVTGSANPEAEGEEPKCSECKWRKELWPPDMTAGGHCYMFRDKMMGCAQWRAEGSPSVRISDDAT